MVNPLNYINYFAMHRGYALLFLCGLIGSLTSGFAQDCSVELRGRVMDRHENIPLEGALIVLEENQAYTYSDARGLFVLESLCAGTYTLRISHPSCDDYTKQLSLQTDLDETFFLEHHITALNEIIVEEQKRQKNTETTPEVVLQGNELERFSGQSLGDALSQVSGVTTLKTGNVIVKPVIHGMFGARVALVSEGVRVNDQEWGADHAPTVDLNAVEQISVIKGAATLRYGGDTPGGVIVMQKGKPFLKDTLYGHLLSSASANGRGGAMTGSLVKGFANGNYVKGQATIKKRGDAQAPAYNLSNTGWTEAAMSMQWGRNQFLKGWEVNYSFFQNTIGILRAAHVGNVEDLERALRSEVPLRIDPFTYTIAAPKQQSQHHNAKFYYFKRWAADTKLEVHYNFQWNQREEFDIRRGEDRNKAAIDLQLMTQKLAAHLAWTGAESMAYTAGIQAELQDNFSNPDTGVKRLIPDYLKYTLAGYTTARYQPDNSLTIDAGLRLDWTLMDAQKYYDINDWEQRGYDNRYSQFEVRRLSTQLLTRPKFEFLNWAFSTGVRSQWNPVFETTLNYNLSQRAPNAAELFSDGLHHALATIEYGSLDLKKEIAHKVLLNSTYIKEGLNLNLTPYLSWVNDFILLEPAGFEQTIRGAFPYYHYKGVDAQFVGVDFEMQWRVHPQISLLQQTNWVRAKEAKTQIDLIHIPPLSAHQKLVFVHPQKKGWKWEIYNTQVASQRFFPDNNFTYQFIENGQLTTKTIDISTPPNGYSLWGSSLVLQWDLEGQRSIQLQCIVDNLANTTYRSYLNRLRFYADEMGRNIQVLIKYSL